MHNEKKDSSKDELVEQDLTTEKEVEEANFHKALGVVTRYMLENDKINEHITYINKPKDGLQMQTTVHVGSKFIGSQEELEKHVNNMKQNGVENES